MYPLTAGRPIGTHCSHLILRHEIVNINLKTKPEWYLAKSVTGGKVPALELDDKYLPESLLTSDLLEELYPEPALYPTDPLEEGPGSPLGRALRAGEPAGARCSVPEYNNCKRTERKVKSPFTIPAYTPA